MGIHVHDNIPQDLTPAGALKRLQDGNYRFINNLKLNRNLLELVNDTKDGQWPFAAILSCMDSRTSAELVFDQGLGDVFSIRIGGNVITPGILGSLEYATAVAGSKLILVLGHTNCGAVKGACDNVQFGHLTSLLDKIKPSVNKVHPTKGDRNSTNASFVNDVAKVNVYNSIQQIMEQSEVIRDLVDKGQVGLVPAMYDVATGKVTFFEQEARIKMLAEQQNQYNRVA
jgi:carbonic anhydrase